MEQANQLDKGLKQYMNVEHIVDEFYEIIIRWLTRIFLK